MRCLLCFTLGYVKRFASDTLAFPGYVAVASAILFILHLILASLSSKRRVFRRPPALELDNQVNLTPDVHADSLSVELGTHIARHGGVIFMYKIMRLLGCLALLGVSIYSFSFDDAVNSQGMGSWRKWREKHKHRKYQGYNPSVKEWLELSLCMNYVCSVHVGSVLRI